MGDWMHPDVPTDYIDEMLDVVGACPQHIFLTLTKRPENLEKKLYEVTVENPCRALGGGDYPPNLWLGVSVENQETADARIPLLLQLPGFKKFISYEPAIGPGPGGFFKMDSKAWLAHHGRRERPQSAAIISSVGAGCPRPVPRRKIPFLVQGV